MLGGGGIDPREVGGEIALLCSHLVDASCHKFAQAHERVGGDRQRVGVIRQGQGHSFPIHSEERFRFPSESLIGGPHDISGREVGGVWEEVPICKWGTGEGA